MKARRQSQGQLSRGDKVEVKRSNGAYYAATVLRSPSALHKNMVFVEYQVVYERSKRVKRYVDLSHVRPLPPLELNCCFKPGDSVDAYWENGWRKGVVKDVLENSKYAVGFGNGEKEEEESEIERCNLRLHREWDDGSWIPPLTEPTVSSTEKKVDKSRKVKVKIVFGKRPAGAKFQKDDKVEVTSDEEGFKGSWFSAVVFEYTGNDKYLVEYLTLGTEEEMPVRKEAKACHIRPCPPELPAAASFRLREVVDAWYNDGWWVGVICKVRTGSKYVVYFSLTNEELEFDHSNLRIHQDWMNGKWIIASEEKSGQLVTNDNKLLLPEMDVEEKRFQAKFYKGMKVEVKSDEYGYEGSWFSAVIVGSLGNDKYLVEYLTLKTEDQRAFLREEAYASYIRPYPPHVHRAYAYQLLENVDAWYNDGWWIGQINKVLTGRRYSVYFSTTNEVLEFEHGDLRPHQEWSNGKWVISSSARLADIAKKSLCWSSY